MAPERREPEILVLDDDPAMRMTMVGLLDVCGIQVVGASPDGGQGISLARRVRPDILLMEMPKPPSVGVVVIRELTRLLPATRVVVCTEDDDARLHDAARDAGATAVVVKGTPPARLAATVRWAWRQGGDEAGAAGEDGQA